MIARPIAALALAALLISGCGGDDDGGEPSAAAPPPPTTTTTEGPGDDSPGPEPAPGSGRGGVALTELGRFSSPVHIAQPPGEERDLYVVEQGGTIRVIDDGKLREEPFLEISDEVVAGGEQGLLSVAFDPDYRLSGLFYVDYTDTNGDSRVVEYRRSSDDPLRADPGSAREVLFQDQPYSNHNGGLLLFGPDKRLYIGFGDGGSAGDPERNGQDLGTFLGKILRIDPHRDGDRPYSVPADNPFAGFEGALPEIYAFGLRNPWRFSFDRRNGVLTIGDVGQSAFEEIDVVPASGGAGANFGWSAFEGDVPYNSDETAEGSIFPALTYGREEGCSVTGGYVVRDRNLKSLYGRYLYGDYCAGRLRSFIPARDGARDDRELGLEVDAISSFGEDNAGRIYVVSLSGPVYRLDPK